MSLAGTQELGLVVQRTPHTGRLHELRIPKDAERQSYQGTPYVGWERYRHMAWQFINRFRHHIIDVSDEDLYQECAIAIFRAMELFDPSRNLCMSTLVYTCIRQRLLNISKYARFKKNEMVRNAARTFIGVRDPDDHARYVDLVCDIEARLDEDDRKIFTCLLGHSTIDDIRSIMEITHEQVEEAVKRIRSTVRRLAHRSF